MAAPLPANEIASLKAELQGFLNEDPVNSERILSRMDQLGWSVGSGPFSGLLLLLCNLDLEESEARGLWDAACDLRERLEHALGRPVPLRVALLDLIIARNRGTARVRVLDLVQTRRPGEHEMTDPISGLHTAAFFDDQLPREVGRARRFDLPLSLVHVEIDEFTKVIEPFGAYLGSILLKEVGGIIAGCLRDMDYAARVAGAQFSLLLTETDRMGAYYVADRLRQKVDAFYLERQIDGSPFAVTVSSGVAAFPQDAESAVELVARASQAFYNARIKGRGGVAVYHRERREYMRLESPSDRLKVTIMPEGETSDALADMKNISSGGVLFESERPIPLGRMVQIQCHNLKEDAEVLIPGRVVRLERFESEFGERYEIGVLFDLVVEEQLEGVIDFLEKFISEETEETSGRSTGASDSTGAS